MARAPGAVTARRGPKDARRPCGGVSGRAAPSLRHPRSGILIQIVSKRYWIGRRSTATSPDRHDCSVDKRRPGATFSTAIRSKSLYGAGERAYIDGSGRIPS